MNLKLSIIVFLVCLGQIVPVCGQTNPESFFVKYITMETDPNPRFVWSYANMIISWDKESNNDEVSCLKKELMKTGLFNKIESRLNKLKESDDYELVLTIKYNSPNPTYKVSEIKLIGFKEVDESRFKELLISENLIGKSLSLKTDYPDFENKIIELVKESITDETKKEEFKIPWFELTLNKNKDLEVTVMPNFKGCSEISQ